MPRASRNIKRINITIPEELIARIDMYLMDPATGRPRYGAFSHVTTALWIQLIRQLEHPSTDPIALLRRYGVDIPNTNPESQEQETAQ